MLLKAGANPNQVNRWGDTPLHEARTVEQTEVLLKEGADPNKVNNDWGFTPLHKARTAEQTVLLLKGGANPGVVNIWDSTPLYYARTTEQKILLENYSNDPGEVRAAYIIQRNYRIVLMNRKMERFRNRWFRLLGTVKYHPTFIEDPVDKIVGRSARSDLLEMGFDD
jgi:ankyrin repeat protein